MQHPDLEKDYHSIFGAAIAASQDEIEHLCNDGTRLA